MGARLKNEFTFLAIVLSLSFLVAIAPNAIAQSGLPETSGGNIGLPTSSGDVGKLRRGHDGKIIRTGPSEAQPDISPETINTPIAPGIIRSAKPPKSPTNPSNKPTRREQRYSTRLLEDLQRHSDHETRANRQQIEIDALLRAEDRARISGAPVDARGLTAREIALFERLQRRHRDVIRHEMAHFQTGQPYASFPRYFYVRGPLNQQFAISGIVKFNATPVPGNKKETLIKLEKLRRAALAPRTPSNQDRRVASELARLITILRAGR